MMGFREGFGLVGYSKTIYYSTGIPVSSWHISNLVECAPHSGEAAGRCQGVSLMGSITPVPDRLTSAREMAFLGKKIPPVKGVLLPVPYQEQEDQGQDDGAEHPRSQWLMTRSCSLE